VYALTGLTESVIVRSLSHMPCIDSSTHLSTSSINRRVHLSL